MGATSKKVFQVFRGDIVALFFAFIVSHCWVKHYLFTPIRACAYSSLTHAFIQGQEGVMDGVEESGYVAGHAGSDQGPAVKVGATGLSDQGHADQVGLVVFPSSSVATSLQSRLVLKIDTN